MPHEKLKMDPVIIYLRKVKNYFHKARHREMDQNIFLLCLFLIFGIPRAAFVFVEIDSIPNISLKLIVGLKDDGMLPFF